MSQMTKIRCELLPNDTCDLYAPRPEHPDSRTLLKQYFLDPVLPLLTLLSMSVLTVVMLVTLVTTVADMDLHLPDGYVSVDPWAGAALGPTGGYYQDQVAYTDSVTSMDTTENHESWPRLQTGDPF